jgi:hypothetical protein
VKHNPFANNHIHVPISWYSVNKYMTVPIFLEAIDSIIFICFLEDAYDLLWWCLVWPTAPIPNPVCAAINIHKIPILQQA